MEAKNQGFLKFMRDAMQFVIPIYQRKYSWEIEQCQQLWSDILRAGTTELGGHFVGSIVYIADNDSHNTPLLVIDGQQRLTTLTLLIAALSEAVGDDEPHKGFSKQKLKSYYLTNPFESGDAFRKLVLSEVDRETLFAIVDERKPPDNHSLRIAENYAFFQKKLQETSVDNANISKGLDKLLIVYVALSRKEDNPQLIFESMNSTGRKLSQADLIRNFILMGLESEFQTRLYTQLWHPMEVSFGQEAYDKHFDSFMRHYLTMKTGEIPRFSDVYEAFKRHASPKIKQSGTKALLEDVRYFARYYCAMVMGSENDSALKTAFHDLRELKVDVAYPFLLELYQDYDLGKLAKKEFLEAVRLVEAYVFRRAICTIPTNSLNKTFATFTRSLKKDRYLESIKVHFLLMRSYRRFPSDQELKREMQSRDLYNFRNRSYWLRRFENHERKERVNVDEYTIEHIMPQNERVSSGWQNELGGEWKRIRETYLHTLGNLTLTRYNSEYSDRLFKEKRDMSGGFSQSPLRVNQGLGQVDKWDEEAIKARASMLAAQAIDVWAAPVVPDDVLATSQAQSSKTSDYSIENHSHLLNSPTRELFEAFRNEVLQLDPCVNEEFLKLYVAYKAETNFVDVVPRAKQLRLYLNMNFSEISDPRGMCRDVSGIGRWGNGEVEIRFIGLDDLLYVIGLVRQSLESQLGNGEDA
ncbi:MAG: DUF262 domain-containing protein [Alphaproteobacteria bacterium]|nr:DUF262 domain-containing protein [Alphaproteobacteria bacterium]